VRLDLLLHLNLIRNYQQVERERREFVANVSHELRTPLTSMNSYIEALEEGAWKDEELAPQFLINEHVKVDNFFIDLIRLIIHFR
jgi:two-component system sensor histidine kinase VicK